MKAHASSGFYKWRALTRLNEFYFRAEWDQLARWLNYFCDSLSGPYVDYYWKVKQTKARFLVKLPRVY